MKLKYRIGTFLAIVSVVALGSRLVAGPENDKPKKEEVAKPAKRIFKPVLTVEETMEGQANLMKSIKSGILDGAWDEASIRATVLAELSNTNQLHNDAKDYKTWARGLSKDCLELARALKKRDEKESKALIMRANEKCSACHEVYKKKW